VAACSFSRRPSFPVPDARPSRGAGTRRSHLALAEHWQRHIAPRSAREPSHAKMAPTQRALSAARVPGRRDDQRQSWDASGASVGLHALPNHLARIARPGGILRMGEAFLVGSAPGSVLHDNGRAGPCRQSAKRTGRLSNLVAHAASNSAVCGARFFLMRFGGFGGVGARSAMGVSQ